MNDTLFYEIKDKFISSGMFPPGNHRIMVSSLYVGGESHWIGPIELTVPGPRVVFEDPAVEQIILDELRRNDSSSVINPTSDKVLTISRIEINQPVFSLKGLEFCKNLQVLNISGSGQELDLTPVSSLKRLKSLVIKDITPLNIELIGNNNRLFELHLERTPLPDLSFMLSLKNLLNLYIRDVQVSDPAIISDLSLLEKLTLSNCGITQAEFAESLTHLKSLDLSDNAITRIRWSVNNYNLQNLNLSNNQISDLFFLDKLKVIRDFNVSRNQLERFVTGQIFSNLISLDLSYNDIDSLFLTYPALLLSKLSIQGNHIRTITGLKNFTPGLTWLDFSGNDLQELWSGCLQKLQYLDISNNRITHLLSITNHPLLTHLACNGNRITDLYPLVTRDFYRQLDYLSVTDNPLTTESLDIFIARMRGGIDTLLVPQSAEPMSPGYPVPARNGLVSGNQAELFWETSGSPAIVRYELLTGDTPDDLRIRYDNLQEQNCTMEVYSGHTYFWAVRSVTADTSFMSGIFNFHTFTPVTLPVIEKFETYPVFSYITEVSPGWINQYVSGTLIRDGRIIGFKKYEGRYALSVGTETGLLLPLDHLTQRNLSIMQQILVETGKKACFRIKNINGSDLDIYFKSSGRCDIIFNQLFIKEIEYPQDQWFTFEVYAWGGVSKIKVKIGNTNVELPWLFPTQNVHVGELEYSCASSPYYPQDGFPLYYVDNLEISASGIVSDQKELFYRNPVVYPNPADSHLDILIPGSISDPKPVLFDNSGRKIDPEYNHRESDRIRIHTTGLKSGIYYLYLTNYPEFKAVRVMIVH
jgi:Leucine-rich repeat (LRR) protein